MHELSSADKWLLRALRQNTDLSIVSDALSDGANINVLGEEGTPIIVAVKNNKSTDVLRLLTESYALINLVDRDFNTAIEVAAQSGMYDALFLLLGCRESFISADGKKVLSDYVKYCVDHYLNRIGEEFSAQNHALIAHYASRLCGTNVGNLFASDFNDEKYIVHLYGFRNAARGEIRLEGWQPQFFLPLRIYSFFEILVKLQKGVIKPWSENPAVLENLLQNIETEILMACEALRTVRDRLAIEKIKVVLEEREEQNQEEQDQAIASEVISGGEDMEGDEPEGSHPDDSLCTRIDELYLQLARGILRRVFILQQGESYPVSIGFTDHEIYLNFFSSEPHILCRIDNLGYASDLHTRDPNNPANIKPFQLCSILKNTLPDADDMQTYLVEVLRTKNREETVENPANLENIAEQREKIYNLPLKAARQSYLGKWPQQFSHALQPAGNCVLESQQLGLFLRLDKETFEWLLNQERQCVVNQDRKKYAPQAGEAKYWKEELLGDANEKPYEFAFQLFSTIQILDDLFNVWALQIGSESEIENFQSEVKKSRGLPRNNHSFTWNVFTAFRSKDFEELGTLASRFLAPVFPGADFEQARLMQGGLYSIAAYVFSNQTESVDGYHQLQKILEDLHSRKWMNSFLYLFKGLLHLKEALHYRSISMFYKARETFGLAERDLNSFRGASDPLLRFFIYYFLGICEYYLNNHQKAYENFAKALSKINSLENFSSLAPRKKQACLTCLGYLAFQLEKTEEAQEYFYAAQGILFEFEENHPAILGKTQVVQKQNPTPEIYLGLGICTELIASRKNLVIHKIEFYLAAKEFFEQCKFSANHSISGLAERKIEDIERIRAKLEKPQGGDPHTFFKRAQKKLKKRDRSLKANVAHEGAARKKKRLEKPRRFFH